MRRSSIPKSNDRYFFKERVNWPEETEPFPPKTSYNVKTIIMPDEHAQYLYLSNWQITILFNTLKQNIVGISILLLTILPLLLIIYNRSPWIIINSEEIIKKPKNPQDFLSINVLINNLQTNQNNFYLLLLLLINNKTIIFSDDKKLFLNKNYKGYNNSKVLIHILETIFDNKYSNSFDSKLSFYEYKKLINYYWFDLMDIISCDFIKNNLFKRDPFHFYYRDVCLSVFISCLCLICVYFSSYLKTGVFYWIEIEYYYILCLFVLCCSFISKYMLHSYTIEGAILRAKWIFHLNQSNDEKMNLQTFKDNSNKEIINLLSNEIFSQNQIQLLNLHMKNQ